MDATQTAKKTIVFLHPDLGIGGAERLVVDAAVGLQRRGHRVVVFTSHCDPGHCFDEVRPAATGPGPGGGLVDVRVRGGWLVPPALLGGRFAVVCAIARQAHLLLALAWAGELAALGPTAFFVDQLSAGLPLLRRVAAGAGAGAGAGASPPIFFYCHFPDLLLVQGRAQSLWKRLYRRPFDALEQWSMGFADAVAVNSRFTRAVVTATWPGLAGALAARRRRRRRRTQKADDDDDDDDDDDGLRVVYPCIDTTQEDAWAADAERVAAAAALWHGVPFVLSINRFERKKDVGLAICAFAGLPAAQRHGARLVLAGGYDTRVAENVAYHHELDALASALGLRTATAHDVGGEAPPAADVLFLLSVPAAAKALLLHAPGCRLLAYTPAHEHFGIVPLEAMLAGVPVLACDSGGPTETVVEGVTGWLRPADDVAAWTAVLADVLPPAAAATTTTTADRSASDDTPSASAAARDAKRAAMAAAGRARVRSQFAESQMAARLDAILDEIVEEAAQRPATSGLTPIVAVILLLAAVGMGLLAVLVAAVLRPTR